MTIYIDTNPELEWESKDGRYLFALAHKLLRYRIIWYGEVCDLVIEACYNTELDQWVHLSILGSEIRHEEIAKELAQSDYDRRTAERFKVAEVPEIIYKGYDIDDYTIGYNNAVDELHRNIAKAKEQG